MRAAIGIGCLLLLALPFPGLKAEESKPRPGVPTFLSAHPFVHRPGRPYVNRAKTDYEIPDQTLLPPFDRRNYYGPLGHHLIYGYDVFSWRETRADFPIGQAPNSQLFKQNARYGLLDRNIVGFDSYNDWSARLIIGDEIRTFFTPLTLDMTGVNGIRLDVDKGPTQFSLLASRFRDPIWVAGTPRVRSAQRIPAHGRARRIALGCAHLGSEWRPLQSLRQRAGRFFPPRRSARGPSFAQFYHCALCRRFPRRRARWRCYFRGAPADQRRVPAGYCARVGAH